MERKAVSSSVIASIGYDPVDKTLEVEFNENGLYRYHNVPPSLYESLMSAPSQGVYFNKHIRDQFPFERAR